MLKFATLLCKINLIKTLYFNLRYLPFSQAIKLPIMIYRHTDFYRLKGSVEIDAPVKMGMVKIGPHGLGTQNTRSPKSMWEVSGKVVFKGLAVIGRGSRISVGADGVLTLGDRFRITGDSSIICQKEVSFGEDCLLSWHILIMDTDFHRILKDGNTINEAKAVTIGKHVWIGCRTTILKGVSIGDSVVVSANSTITKSIKEDNCIIGGHGKSVEVLKTGVDWMP